MAATDTVRAPATNRPAGPRPGWARGAVWWMVGGFALLMLLVLGWKFLADPSLSAPTRPRLVHVARPGDPRGRPRAGRRGVGPNGLFAGGYRVTVPLAGALLQQVVGIDRYTSAPI